MIDPVALHVGPFPIYWYGIIISLAFLTGTGIAYYLAPKNGIDPDHMLNIVILIIPGAIIGARLYYVAFQWELYAGNISQIIAIWHGGLAIHGGIIGGVLAGLIYTRINNLAPWKIADIVAPGLILGQAIGRWGNFINQEAHGGPVSLDFISYFPAFIQKQMFIQGQYYHPTFLYESVWNVGVFLVLILFWSHKKFHGQIALLYLVLYSTGRYFIEDMRTDSLMLGSIQVAQLVSIALIVIGLAGMIIGYYRSQRN